MQLRKIRLGQGMSIAKLSEISKVPVRTLEDIERRGDCRVSTALKVAAALEVSMDELCKPGE